MKTWIAIVLGTALVGLLAPAALAHFHLLEPKLWVDEKYASAAGFEASAVAGYAAQLAPDTGGNYRLVTPI